MKTIFLFDDDEKFCKRFNAAVATCGGAWQLVYRTSLTKSLRAINERRYDIYVIDIVIDPNPETDRRLSDGWTLFDAIADLQPPVNAPRIVISTMWNPADAARRGGTGKKNIWWPEGKDHYFLSKVGFLQHLPQHPELVDEILTEILSAFLLRE